MPGEISRSYEGPSDQKPEISSWALRPLEQLDGHVPFTHCQVCGIKLGPHDEIVGMCNRCADE